MAKNTNKKRKRQRVAVHAARRAEYKRRNTPKKKDPDPVTTFFAGLHENGFKPTEEDTRQ